MLKYIVPFILLVCVGSAVSEQVQEKSNALCQTCTITLTFAQKYLEENSTEEEVINFVKNDLCNKLGGLAATCNSYVDQFGKTILYELASKIDPSVVCSHLGLCTHVINLRPRVSDMKSNQFCTYCELAFKEMIVLLNNPELQKKVFTFLDNDVCAKMGKFAQQCKSLVDSVGPSVLAKLIGLINPTQVCQKVQLCDAAIPTGVSKPENFWSTLLPIHIQADPSNCILCKTFVLTLETELKSASVQQQLEQVLQNFCKSLPQSFQQVCTLAVTQYTPTAVNAFVQWLEKENVCKAIKMCDN